MSSDLTHGDLSFSELVSAYLSRPLSATHSPIDFARHVTNGRYLAPQHLRLINEKLVAVANGECRKLIIEAPPRHGKSWLVSRYFPAWFEGAHPESRIILASYEAEFAAKWGLASKTLLEEYGPSLFGVQLNRDSSAAARWDIEGHEGGAAFVGAEGPITGKGANVLILEDIIKNQEQALSATRRESLWAWFQSVAFTRLEPGGAIIISGARWHEDDIPGRLLAGEDANEWEVLRFPAIAEEDDMLGRVPGEALWPERYSVEELEAIRRTVGEYVWASLYQQSPVPLGGNIIQRKWFRYWHPADQVLPPVTFRLPDGELFECHATPRPKVFDSLTQSWDLSFKDTTSSDYVVGQVWGRTGANRYLLDQVRERMDFPKTIEAMLKMTVKWPGARRKLVEEKANGAALISTLKDKVAGIIPINPTVDKVARTHAVTPFLEAGNVYIPHPHSAPWVNGFINTCVKFPNVKFDDEVDTLTQELNDRNRGGRISVVGRILG
jgi:predicted phage terminase large subunit-like protein